MKNIRCIRCSEEFEDKELIDLSFDECPKCGGPGSPMLISQDIQLSINWNELRILTIYASNWAESLDDDCKIDLMSILKRLEKYRPEGASALTIVGEFKEMQKYFPNSELWMDGEVIVPPKDDFPFV
jgi:hypothetical protein